MTSRFCIFSYVTISAADLYDTFTVDCQGLVQLGALIAGLPLVGPTKVKAYIEQELL